MWLLAGVVLAVWLAGLLTSHVLGGWLHLLAGVAILLVVTALVRMRRPAA